MTKKIDFTDFIESLRSLSIEEKTLIFCPQAEKKFKIKPYILLCDDFCEKVSDTMIFCLSLNDKEEAKKNFVAAVVSYAKDELERNHSNEATTIYISQDSRENIANFIGKKFGEHFEELRKSYDKINKIVEKDSLLKGKRIGGFSDLVKPRRSSDFSRY